MKIYEFDISGIHGTVGLIIADNMNQAIEMLKKEFPDNCYITNDSNVNEESFSNGNIDIILVSETTEPGIYITQE